MKKLISIILISVAALTVASCSSSSKTPSSSSSEKTTEKNSGETQYPVTVKTYNAEGEEIKQVFERAPKKVIANNLSTVEILIELGLDDKIVGMFEPDNAVTGKYQEFVKTIPRIGDKKTISQEAVLALEIKLRMLRHSS